MRTYTIDEMKRAFECGRNFQLTAENNFQELIEELNQVNKISSNPMLVDSLPCSHQYSRSMNQPYPRKCVKCREVEKANTLLRYWKSSMNFARGKCEMFANFTAKNI